MSKERNNNSDFRSTIERLLTLLISDDGSRKAKLTIILGAGASREFGIPTTWELALEFYDSGLSRISQHSSTIDSNNLIENFVDELGNELDTDVAYAFFRTIEKKSEELIKSGNILTYDRILHLWAEGYVKFVATTNFDKALELRLQATKLEGHITSFNLVVLDYSDLGKLERPRLPDGQMLAKLAGEIDRSNMLWTVNDFKTNITPSVQTWLEQTISETPLLMLGYTASEEPLRNVFSKHKMYGVSVAPKPIDDIETLSILTKSRSKPLDHAETTAGVFIEYMYERLYEKTKNDELKLSIGYIKDVIARLMENMVQYHAAHQIISRGELEDRIFNHPYSRDSSERMLILLGDSGTGKSTLLSRATAQADRQLTLLIPASEVVNSLDDWSKRLGTSSLNDLCDLVSSMQCGLTIILDGLNEEAKPDQASRLLSNVVGILDYTDDPAIRVIVSCRSDVWRRLKLDVSRSYCPPPIQLEGFDSNERQLAIELIDHRNQEHVLLNELLRLPENLGFVLELEDDIKMITNEAVLLIKLLARRRAELSNGDGPLIWFCRQMRERKIVSLDTESIDISSRRLFGLTEASDAGLLSINRFLVIRFQEDRMAECYFGAVYLYQYCWKEEEVGDISLYFQSLVNEYHNLDQKYSSFKVLFLNALIFFLCACSDDEFEEVYISKHDHCKNMLRTAAVMKRALSYKPCYRSDPALMSVCLLTEKNYSIIWDEMSNSDMRFISNYPFAFAAKRFPLAFAKFTQGLVERVMNVQSNTERRPLLSAACSCLLILALRQGPQYIISNKRLKLSIIELCKSVPADYLVSRIAESLSDNSKLLFHWHPTAKASDIFELPANVHKSLLLATNDSIHSLSTTDLCDLVRCSPASRLIGRLLMFRDLKDSRSLTTLEQLFTTGELTIQDFVVGVLGFAGKSDKRYIDTSASYVKRMRDEFPHNFYESALDDVNPVESQYDPLVPHVTTMLEHDGTIDLNQYLPEGNIKRALRVGRLAQKTALDFPEVTLRFSAEYIDQTGGINEELKTALAMIARHFPVVFWRMLRKIEPSLLFSITDIEIDDSERLIMQIRDYDWLNTYRYFENENTGKNNLTPLLNSILNSPSLEAWIEKGVLNLN